MPPANKRGRHKHFVDTAFFLIKIGELRWLDTVLLKIDSFAKPQNSSTNFYPIILCWMWKVFSLHKLLYEV